MGRINSIPPEIEEKILACHGNITVPSMATIFGFSRTLISATLRRNNLETVQSNMHRRKPY